VKKIQQSPCQGQTLAPPIKIFSAGRPAGPDRIAVQHILIAFRGSIPDEKITRSSRKTMTELNMCRTRLPKWRRPGEKRQIVRSTMIESVASGEYPKP
jgi:hypothetical protein